LKNYNLAEVPDSTKKSSIELLKSITCLSQYLYGVSGCDSCKNGVCLPTIFNSISDSCKCYPGYQNYLYSNCTEEIEPSFTSLSDPSIQTVLVFYAITILLFLFTICIILYKKKHPIIKFISPTFCYIVASTCIIQLNHIFFLVGTPDNLTCGVRIWIINLPITVLFSTFVIKLYKLVTAYQNKRLLKVQLETSTVLKYIIILSLPEFVGSLF
jgi:hypothetical protein